MRGRPRSVAMREFDIIREYFSPLAHNKAWLSAGIGEDCALLDHRVFAGEQAAISIDTLVAGVHFPDDLPLSSVSDLARRSLAVALSDLAACAAKPIGFTIALSLPETGRNWLDAFSSGLAEGIKLWSVELLGGDLSAGPLSITIQVLGRVPAGRSLRRSGARPGDALYLSGCTGEAASALLLMRKPVEVAPSVRAHALSRYWSPQPRIQLGIELRSLATSAIDISDGLLADATHIAEMSGCSLSVEPDKLPLSDTLRQVAGDDALDLALAGGDDYELLFTAPASAHDDVVRTGRSCGVDCTRIGTVAEGSGVHCAAKVRNFGWEHFTHLEGAP